MNENKPSIEPKIFLAIFLSLGFFLLWSSWIQKKYPASEKTQITEGTKQATPPQNTLQNKKHTQAQLLGGELKNTVKKEDTFFYEDENWSFYVSSFGMGFKNVKLKKYQDRKGEDIELASYKSKYLPYEVRLEGDDTPLYFSMKKISKNHFEGRAQRGGLVVKQNLRVLSEKYLVQNDLSVKGNLDNFKGINIYIPDSFEASTGGFLSSIFSPNHNLKKILVLENTESEWLLPQDAESQEENFSHVTALATTTQYFSSVFINKSGASPDAHVISGGDKNEILSTISFKVPKGAILKEYVLNYALFFGPKEGKRIEHLQEGLIELLDFGFFSSIGKLLLKSMQFFYGIFGNWGVAIIFLTFLIRLIVLPFNIISYKSMRKMAQVGPILQELKKKHKDDQQKMNSEVLKIYKEHNVNPMMGCLPMLLQMPIFFALYGVLRQSIELYKAPFFFWVQDLSISDPYYVFPFLLFVTMILQQKFSPSSHTMEPLQRRMMYVMLGFFSLMMLPFSSGLTLSFFISGLWAVVQQGLFYKFDDTNKTKEIA